jgi:hypothetical protein
LVCQDYAQVTFAGWGALAYAAVFSGIVTNLLYFTAIGRVGSLESCPSGTKTRSCGPRVLVDEPAEEISPFDFGRTVGLSTGARLSVA